MDETRQSSIASTIGCATPVEKDQEQAPEKAYFLGLKQEDGTGRGAEGSARKTAGGSGTNAGRHDDA
jgi:hypothetical protein